MRIGGRRYGADLTSGLGAQASHGIIPLQSGKHFYVAINVAT